MEVHSSRKDVDIVNDPLTAVIDREETIQPQKIGKAKRLWQIILCCLLCTVLTVSATFAVYFYLGLQEQRRISTAQSDQLVSLQQALSEQSEQLASQRSQISTQESALTSQQSVVDEYQSTIEEQQTTIEQLKKSLAELTPPAKAEGIVSYPVIDVTALKGRKLVALTFDDGPSQYTGKLLDALKEHNAKATFFVVGSRLGSDSSTALLKRMENEGHVVGNHSQNHKNLRYLSAKGIAKEMYAASSLIKNAIGHYPIVMRCPGGNYNNTVRAYAGSINTPIIQWNLDTLDWRDRNKATIVNRVKSGVKDGSIVLMHDLYDTTVDAVIELIPYLQEQGYTLVTVPELLAAKHGTVEAGEVYFGG